MNFGPILKIVNFWPICGRFPPKSQNQNPMLHSVNFWDKNLIFGIWFPYIQRQLDLSGWVTKMNFAFFWDTLLLLSQGTISHNAGETWVKWLWLFMISTCRSLILLLILMLMLLTACWQLDSRSGVERYIAIITSVGRWLATIGLEIIACDGHWTSKTSVLMT